MSDKNIKLAEIGADMWISLHPFFIEACKLHGAETKDEMTFMWAGFMGAIAGSMTHDVGPDRVAFIIDRYKSLSSDLSKSNLKVVK